MAKKKTKNKFGKKSRRKASKPALRGDIMEVFRTNPGKYYNYKQVSSRLGISGAEPRKMVQEVMNELGNMNMLEAGDKGKFNIHNSQVAEVTGSIDFTKSGAAYVVTDQMDGDVYIPESKTGAAFHGDEVAISITGKRRGKSEGKVTGIVSRAKTEFVGIIDISEKHAFLIPSNSRVHTDFYVDKRKLKGAENGQKVIVKLIDWAEGKKSPFAEIVKVLGNPGDHQVEMHAILAEFGLPIEFPQEVLDAADELPTDITKEEIARRRDFRDRTTFTIDPDDAKDFDDALSLKKLQGGKYEVGVHIADVSHYVKPGSILDKEAINRATSVYLVDRVVPMLPEVLSNQVCSLRPNEEKLCMSAVFEMSNEGKVLKQWFGKTIIESNRRFTYADAQEIIEGKDGDCKEEILKLNTWARRMRKDRLKAGALEFSSTEVKFKLDDEGKPVGVYHKVMKEANFLIEEFMLLANRRVAKSVGNPVGKKNPRPFVYRIHDLPDPEKLATLRDFVKRLGYNLKSVDPEEASRALNDLIHQVEGKVEEDIVKQMAIRTMSKAVYSTENIGHYGLAFEYYSHFTSPIRRYPDVIVHRLLEQYSNTDKNPDQNALEKSCKHSSNMEKQAVEAERASIKYKQVEYMLDKIGENFQGSVSGLTKWGMFVEIDETKVEGMIPLSTMDDDNYYYDDKTNRIIGKRYKEVYEFGDKVQIQVHGADLAAKQLDFRIV